MHGHVTNPTNEEDRRSRKGEEGKKKSEGKEEEGVGRNGRRGEENVMCWEVTEERRQKKEKNQGKVRGCRRERKSW